MALEGTPQDPAPEAPTRAVTCTICPTDENPSVFDRVLVNRLVRGGSRVMWEMRDDFFDPQPFEFQLQAGYTGNNDSDDWVDVGFSVIDTFVAFDDEQRVFNKYPNRTWYRVLVTTPIATYASEPTAGMGTLSVRDWRIARETIRQQQKRLQFDAGQRGVLLKRRITGEDCPTCLDYQTREVRDPDCPDCWGTGKRCGYFFPMDCIWADMDPKTYHTELDGGKGRGTTSDIRVKARMVNTWLLGEEDVWVNLVTDDRFYVHRVQNVAEKRGIPLMADVELRPAPYTDIIYTIEIPQKLAELEI